MEEQILAEQLIFTRVEPPYSPGNTSGYQTVYRSAGLQTNLVEEIEKEYVAIKHSASDLLNGFSFSGW